jgi:phosphatidylserine/phosphatidylglycerophosphate/cardiolipin synthase-like enzyme
LARDTQFEVESGSFLRRVRLEYRAALNEDAQGLGSPRVVLAKACQRVRMFLNVQRRHWDTSKDSELVREFSHRFKTVEWPGDRLPEVYFDPRSLEMDNSKRASMHAKCIVIDRKLAFVSSANFTEAAQIRNIEVGALIRSERFATRLTEHFGVGGRRGSIQYARIRLKCRIMCVGPRAALTENPKAP